MRKCLISVLAFVIIFILAIQVTPALAIEKGLKGVKELRILAEDIRPGFAITAEDLKKETFIILKAKAPELTIIVEDIRVEAFFYIIVALEHLSQDQDKMGYFGNVTLELWRKVFLQDGTGVGAIVWNRRSIIKGPTGREGDQVRRILSEFLTDFVYDYYRANP